MNKDYKSLVRAIRDDLNPEHIATSTSFSEEVATLSYSDILLFVRMAMKAVEPAYTQRTKDAGTRAKEHLERELGNVSFRYQGSVMTNTHIRGYSDIDILIITEEFYGWAKARVQSILASPEGQANFRAESIRKLITESTVTPYQKSSLENLKQLREEAERILLSKYSVCDTSKAKSIKITNLSLNREVDVVVANWFDDVASIINDKGDYRGVEVYDKDVPKRCDADFPFLSIQRINAKSSKTNGRLKRMIRFLKNCKARSDHDINLSSFDINAICYDINETSYANSDFYELVPVIYHQLRSLLNPVKSDELKSVDGREYIFRGNSGKIEGLKLMLSEVESIYADLLKLNQVTLRG
jgi:Nucleotidyltransferase domain